MEQLPLDDDAKAATHELLLEFDAFDANTAWDLGCRLQAAATRHGYPILIDIVVGDLQLFRCAMPGSTPANADWARRKRNLVNLLQTSSYRIALAEVEGRSAITAMALDPRDHAAAGGCFPIRVRGTGMIGTVTVSGLPQREDHGLVVNTIADLLDIDLGDARF